jgi:cell division protein FtsQ
VSRGWPGTLRIRVVERRPMVGIVEGHRVTLLDADGVAFASVAALPPGVVRLQVTRPGPKDPTTVAALQVLADLTGPMRGRVRILRAASPSSVTLVLQDGRRVLWGGAGQTALKLEAAEVLLKMPGTVYDVSRPEVVTRR